MIAIGIDPGQGGGIAYYSHSGKMVSVPMPQTERDILDFLNGIPAQERFAVIEKVHSMPGQGVASTFKFGQNYGFLRGCLVSLGIPFAEASPKTWQKALGLASTKEMSKTQWKTHLKEKAQNLYPSVRQTLKNCDATLIAHYCLLAYVRKSLQSNHPIQSSNDCPER